MHNSHPIILALTDGKAGHETQTQGIVQLLNQQQTYQVEWVHLNIPNKWLYRFIKWQFKFHCNTEWLTHFMTSQQLERIRQQKVAYIVSAGGNTLLANALLKQELLKYCVVKNLVASSLRGIKASYFDVVFTIHASQAHLEHYLYYPIAPNKMSGLTLSVQQAREHLKLQLSDQVISILIGADTKTVGIGSAEQWAAMLRKIREEYPQARMLLTTSRRTPIEFEQALAQYCQQQGVFTTHDQITWVAQGDHCDIKDYICAADWVLCSPDSTSMVAEVVMSGHQLLIFYHEQLVHDLNIKQQLKTLMKQNWLCLFENTQDLDLKKSVSNLQISNHSEMMRLKLQDML
ncbi:ELM1/GtrOC1 family putative glycosyltransferase [Acinetobacter sp. ANC 4641]|uniref:ELM1/GtrOC1 family putative glycosyltransferase n=1 Tax=Acinetobacter sp. ANC 4641 TaxID=2529847 RepID=UPI001039C65B|nr:ELM1/GtrOC1 family putative glycosyltransferase [Acinetobacter sp. ANC 4641]TCB11888.1 hypothetical protein E0H78_06160 [Acinetobacter sp. ANC 4641]